jgi:hypothetical protein
MLPFPLPLPSPLAVHAQNHGHVSEVPNGNYIRLLTATELCVGTYFIRISINIHAEQHRLVRLTSCGW